MSFHRIASDSVRKVYGKIVNPLNLNLTNFRPMVYRPNEIKDLKEYNVHKRVGSATYIVAYNPAR